MASEELSLASFTPNTWSARFALRTTMRDRQYRLRGSEFFRLLETQRVNFFRAIWPEIASRGMRVVVRAQQYSRVRDGGDPEEVHSYMRVARVGTTSLAFEHDVYAAEAGCAAEKWAVASAVAVFVGEDARPAPPPPALAALLQGPLLPVHRSFGPGGIDLREARSLHAGRPRCAAGTVPLLSLPLRARFADEDINQHVNQAMYAAYFEEALLAAGAGAAGDEDGWVARGVPPWLASALKHASPAALCLEHLSEAKAPGEYVVELWAAPVPPGVSPHAWAVLGWVRDSDSTSAAESGGEPAVRCRGVITFYQPGPSSRL